MYRAILRAGLKGERKKYAFVALNLYIVLSFAITTNVWMCIGCVCVCVLDEQFKTLYTYYRINILL